ncbi:glutathione S-transferase [Rubrivivax gelatinosus]|uniref:glutathione S-transferase family protein n=1 Tax=Rubrivivax gelatinosus TaxID=28068 RepID=UPI0019034C4D|nr:glutathione S-transferase family protein [Rubrivivax gelatinosus]MBK1612955.1 glutathione S-transferase [Rubrivivax gelatinosus]
MALQLVIGNKNYSSWSMRPWVLMRQLGIPFEERKLRFDFAEGSDFRREVAAVSPAGLVPVLLDEGFVVWDTLAIAEYLAERFPAAGVWPADTRQRARARSLCAEMHGGFGALRQHCAMNIEAALPDVGERLWAEQPALRRNVARLESMWDEALQASGGPFLFGEFGAADAFYAPVCTRLISYALPVSDATRAYVRRVLAAPGVAAWIADALAEADYIADDEPYRTSR